MADNKSITYDTMTHCAAETKVPKRILRLAKSRGAPGFRGHYIDWHLLGPWIEANLNTLEGEANDNLLKWKTKKEKHLANIAEIEENEARERYLLKEDAYAQITAIALAQKNLLKSKLTQELPAKLLGMNVTEMAVEMERVLQEICKLMEELTVK